LVERFVFDLNVSLPRCKGMFFENIYVTELYLKDL